jgi:hypothetical protein
MKGILSRNGRAERLLAQAEVAAHELWETFKSRRFQRTMCFKLQMAVGLAGNFTHNLSVVSREPWHSQDKRR